MAGGGGGSVQQVPEFIEKIIKKWVIGSYSPTYENNPVVDFLSGRSVTDTIINKNPYLYLVNNTDPLKPPHPGSYIDAITSAMEQATEGVDEENMEDKLKEVISGMRLQLSQTGVLMYNEHHVDNAIVSDTVAKVASDAIPTTLQNLMDGIFRENESLNLSGELSTIASQSYARIKGTLASNLQSLMREFKNEFSQGVNLTKDMIDQKVHDAIDNSITFAKEVVNEAVAKALEVAQSNIVDSVVDQFEARTKTRFNKQKNETLGAMRRLRGANSMSYAVSLFMLEAERQQEVNNYEANLRMKLMEIILGMFNDLSKTGGRQFNDLLKTYLGLYFDYYLNTYKTFASSYMQSVGYDQEMSRSVKQIRSGFYSQEILENLKNLASSKRERVLSFNQALMQGAQLVLEEYRATGGLKLENAKLITEASRIKYVMNREYRQDNLRLKEADSLWNLEVMMRGANLLSTYAGAVQLIPEKPSAARTALAGALSGAAVGTSVGGPIGGVIGAGLGAFGSML